MAQVDTSIYNNLLRPPKSVAEYDAEAMQAQQNKLALQSARMGMEAQQRGIAEEAQMRGVVAGFGADRTANYNALLKTGNIKAAQGYERENADTAKVQAEAKGKQIETASKKIDAAGKALGFVFANPTVQNAMSTLDMLERDGIYDAADVAAFRQQITANPDPALIKSLAEQGYRAALDVKDQLSKVDTRNLGGTTQTMSVDPITGKTTVLNSVQNTQSPDSKAAIVARAAESAADRAEQRRQFGIRESREAQAPRGQIVQSEDGPILVDPRTGKSMPVLGSDGKPVGRTKAPTEFQGKSAIFGARADESDKIIDSMAGKFSPSVVGTKNALEKTWVVGGALGAGMNRFVLSENDQKYDQAKRDFINANLRQESGAAIAESEFDNADKQYFPQPGDSAAVIAQKSRNRKLAVKGLNSNAGKAAFGSDTPTQAAGALPAGWSVEVK